MSILSPEYICARVIVSACYLIAGCAVCIDRGQFTYLIAWLKRSVETGILSPELEDEVHTDESTIVAIDHVDLFDIILDLDIGIEVSQAKGDADMVGEPVLCINRCL